MRPVLVGLLVVSVGANAYLFATRGHAEPTTSAASSASSGASGSGSNAIATPKNRRTAALAGLEREVLERRLAAEEAALDKTRPLDGKFDRGTRTPEVEARVRPALDKVFAPLSKSAQPYDVECRGTVCNVKVLDTSIDPNAWMKPLQRSTAFHAWMFGAGFKVWGEVTDPVADAPYLLRVAITDAIEASPAIAACARQDPKAEVVLTTTLDVSRHLAVASEPDATPLAICARAAALEAVAHVAVSPDVSDLHPVNVHVPTIEDR